MNYDDILYPFYLEYYSNKETFFEKNKDIISKLFADEFPNGAFRFKYTTAKNGDKCYSVSVIIGNRLINNRVGYKTKDIALMSIIDAIRKGDFLRFIEPKIK